ncbi:MAG TPA: glutamate--tRNA ligase family protein, partial [Gemmatimonadaceae bacterium]|nr:glutamate--tRNA ligase family protein [Gemmatimonadaceae bacterium]
MTHDPNSPASPPSPAPAPAPRSNFIREMVAEDVASGKFARPVCTRFPPEPNGYLHIGHSKSLVLNFGLARDFGGTCNLRFDDTNPFTEDIKYVNAIKDDIRWLGFEWSNEFYASDYFEQLYDIAVKLVKEGKAYVDSQNEEEIRQGRGTVTTPGTNSPHRDRTPEENLDLLERMKAGEFEDGAHVLRAKIDMAHPNMIMRDPLLLRIRKATHYRRGDAWCIYPL